MCGWVNVNTDFRWMIGTGRASWRRRGKTGVKSDARGSRSGKLLRKLVCARINLHTSFKTGLNVDIFVQLVSI